MTERSTYPNEGKTKLYLSISSILFAIAVPCIAYFGVFKPENEPLRVWFQRSGSLVTIFSVIADVFIFNIHQFLYPGRMVSVGFDKLKTRFIRLYIALSLVAIFMTIAGTIIWGYGDLFIGL